jgi:hypothetical protein
MRKTLIAIAAAAAMLPAGAWAKPHHQITDAQRADCLMRDNDEDGTEWCVKSGKGMTQAQIDAWYAEDAEMQAKAKPNNKNCMRELGIFKSYGVWYGPPSKEDCRPFIAESIAAAKAPDAAYCAGVHHALNTEIMKQCNKMADTPGIDWDAVAAFRGITVSLNDCVKASAELAAELQK